MPARLTRALLGAGCLVLAAPAVASPTPTVRAALDTLEVAHPTLTTTFRPDSPVPATLTGVEIPTRGETPTARVEGFVRAHRALLGDAELAVVGVSERRGRTVARLVQHHAGLEVLDRASTVTLDADGDVVRFTGAVASIERLDRATIDEASARDLAIRAVMKTPADAPTPEMHARVRRGVVVVGTRGTEVYEVELSRQPLREHLVVRVDAHRGRVIGVRDRIEH